MLSAYLPQIHLKFLLSVEQRRGQKTLSVKIQIENIFSSVDHTVTAETP